MKRLLIFFILFFLGLCLTAFGSSVIDNICAAGTRDRMLIDSVLQSLLAFCLPAWLISGSHRWHNQISFLRLNITPSLKNVIGIFCVYILAVPALNQIIYWNQTLSLPDSLSTLEAYMRNLENIAESATKPRLSAPSLGGLLTGILVVGIITGFSEELFFRAGLQQLIRRCGVSVDMAVWLSAFLFSALHFQFFGFVPRLLMGVMFGYMFVWSGSIWTSAIAHALNNSMVVLTVWLTANGYFEGMDIENLGVSETGFPFMAFISGIAITEFLVFFRKYFFFTSKTLR